MDIIKEIFAARRSYVCCNMASPTWVFLGHETYVRLMNCNDPCIRISHVNKWVEFYSMRVLKVNVNEFIGFGNEVLK